MQAQLIEDREGANVVRFSPRGRKAETELPEAVRLIVQNLSMGIEAELVRGTFVSLTELLAELQAVGTDHLPDSTVDESVAAFASVHDRAHGLVRHIEDKVLLLEDIAKSPGRELLDVSFALRHELRRAFDMDIAEIDHGRAFESAEGRVAHAHGVLRNCFRQCVVLLAQAYEPTLSERAVFADAASRLQESIILRDALAALLAAVKEESKKGFPQSAVGVIERMDVFRREGMSFLMRRDWEMFDAFENEIVAAKDAGEFDYAMNKLLVGLETLLGQVQMRAVFTDAPAQPPARKGFLRAFTSARPATWSAVAASLLLAGGLAFFVDTTVITRGNHLITGADVAKAAAPPKKTEAVKKAEPPKPVEAAKPVEAPKPAEAAKPPAPAKTAAPAKTETPAENGSAAGALTIQVGAFRDGAAAREFAERFGKHGVEARVAAARKDGQPIYRVLVGSFGAGAEAERFGKQLRAKGLAQSFIVTRAG